MSKLRGLQREAWVTCANTNDEATKSLVLAKSLKRVVSNRWVVILVSSKVSLNLRQILHYEFDEVFLMEEDGNSANLEPKDFAKLSAFALLKSFEKCIFIEPSALFLKNADELFEVHKERTFVCLENDPLSIFLFKPNLKFRDAMMKALEARNGTPVVNYIQNWFRNQYSNQSTNEPIFLQSKYCKNISLQDVTNNDMNGILTDSVIVNFLDDPLISEQWTEEHYAKLSLLDCNALKTWMGLYNENLKTETLPMINRTGDGYTKEPIAIVGMSCRYPNSDNLEEFWNLLFRGEDGTGNPPPFRWAQNQTGVYAAEWKKTNAGFLKGPVDELDGKFFGISPKEALFMDPQHRLLLEIIWESLEDASIDPNSLRGTSGSVFLGSWLSDYKDVMMKCESGEFYRTYMGNSIGAMTARVSFLLGMTGPCIATESGCSSAMVALHLACKSLQMGETSLALAGGVNLLLHPFDKDVMPMVISPEGRCKTFDESADGFARGEGCGVLVLKRLSDAIKDGDHIWATIRGSGISQEGLSRSMGTPTVYSESLAMKLALKDAQVAPEEVSYVEAHGTGTRVGDPLEVAAIANAYRSKKRTEPLVIGSVKTNVGHTESCSGITGIMKVVLSMVHETIPPHKNFSKLNPNIDLEAVPAKIPLASIEWKQIPGKPRLGGVSSFGITGTDAHVIIEESPENIPKMSDLLEGSSLERPWHILKVSAKTEEALEILLGRYKEHLGSSANDKLSFPDICYTANTGRANFSHRAIFVGQSKEEIVKCIEQGNVLKRELKSEEEMGKVCFLFTGQGSQYKGMAQELYKTSPVFQLHFDYCGRILAEKYKINIMDALWSNASSEEINRTLYSQTSIFCVEYALLKLWESLGVKPAYVLGHSLGEFAAAVCAGILNVRDALTLVAERSRLIDELPRGKMLVIKADLQTVKSAMTTFCGNGKKKLLDYAAINSSEQTVVAGDSDLVMEFSQYCTQVSKLKNIVLEATHAFHSSHMDPMLDDYRKVARALSLSSENKGNDNDCVYISGMRGGVVQREEINAEYWVQHTREKVDFFDASKQAVELGCKIFIEIGPQPVLSALTMMNNEENRNLTCVTSLKRSANDWHTLLHSVGKLYLEGVNIDWKGLDEFYSRNKVRLPHYPFIRKKYWPDMMTKASGSTLHPLLGSVISNASSVKLFENGLNLRNLEYIKDHSIGQNVIFPGAGYLEMVLAAGHATVECATDSLVKPTRPLKVENLSIAAPLGLKEAESSQVQVIVEFNDNNSPTKDWSDMSTNIFQKLDTKWLCHAKATFTPLPSAEEIKSVHFDMDAFQKLRALPPNDTLVSKTYEKLASVGLKFGPIFQSIEHVWTDETFGLLAKVKVPVEDSTGNRESHQYIVHPVVLDAMIQATIMQKHSDKKKTLYVPISIAKFLWIAHPQGEELYIHTRDKNEVILVDEVGTVLAVMSGIELIDTTVKAVESVLEQQTCVLPDLWIESWRGKEGSRQHRISQSILSENVYNDDFREYMENTYNVVPQSKQDLFNNLEELVYTWVLNSLYECGWVPELTTKSFSVDALVRKLQIEKNHTQLLNYFLEILGEHGIVKREEGEKLRWHITCLPPKPDEVQRTLQLPLYTEELVKKFDATRLIHRVGENLSSIFKGKQSALQVLFPEDTKNNPTVGGFYDDYGSFFNIVGSIRDVQRQRLTGFLDLMKKKLGDTKFRFRILEVGAGTGIFTSKILPVIDELGVEFEYVYTDISPAFFGAAQKRFEKFSESMKFKKLNIEEDPVSQGFVPGYYDYICASDVIHATKDICQSLRNVRKLLRDGGNFDILEQIQKNRICTFIFGLMDGFWRFEDFRKDHCILTVPEWERCLKQSGFERTITFPSFKRHGLITSWASENNVEPVAKRLPEHTASWIIFSNEDCPLSKFIRDQLGLTSRRAVIIQPSQHGFEEVNSELFRVSYSSKPDFERLMDIMKSRKVPVEGVVYLWSLDRSRTKQEEVLQPFFYIAQTIFSLKQRLMPRIIAVTQGIAPIGDNDLYHFHPSTLWGFTKAFRNENTDVNCRCISIANEASSLSHNEMWEVYHELFCDDKESQVAFSEGIRHVARFQRAKPTMEELRLPPGSNRFQLILPETKSIRDLQFGPLGHFILEPHEIEIQVKASALNFRDVFSVMKPSEEFKKINSVGFDFAGVVRRTGSNAKKWKLGDLVFGVNVKGAPLPSHIKLNEKDVLRVPEKMTLCEACTLSAVCSTAYYCLIDLAQVKAEEKVLIHTASGGVGLSAIEILKSIGATIIATVGSKRKRKYLENLGIPSNHIFHSRNTKYGDEILRLTKGRGVDVVLNSLTSEGFKEATLKACAKGARFIEMSKLSIWEPEEVRKLRPDVQYTIVDLSASEPELWWRLMGCLETLSEKNIVHPIPYVRFDAVNIREALQYLQKAKHIGKVVCVMPEVRQNKSGELEVHTPLFNSSSTYLITGGLGGIGLSVGQWMVEKHGAKHVLLAGRKSPTSKVQQEISRLNAENGSNLIAVELDVGNYEQCKELLHSKIQAWGLPPLRGIMHAAGTLSDGLIANQEWNKLSSTFQAKINGTLNLHELTLGLRLEHFVLFSSITALYGTPGQCNHAAGNNFEDVFAHYRNSIGLCATTINWGQWGEVGVAVEVDLPGMKPLSTLQGLAALEHVMKTQRLQTGVMNMESFLLFSKLSPQTAVYLDERIWKSGGSTSSSMTIKSDEFWQQYDSKEDTSEKVPFLKSQLKDILRKILKLDNDEPIACDANFQEMGVDSLMFVEIKNSVQVLLGDRVTVTASVLRDCTTVQLLADQLIKFIEGDHAVIKQDELPTPEEVNALLLEDCQLPDHITAVGRPYKPVSEIKTILLTGATGTLGPYILKELSHIPRITEIYCLIRPNKSMTSVERLEKALDRCDLLANVDMTKVKCVEGNVAKPKLGLEDNAWTLLTEKIDAVFHCAVKADHTQFYRKRESGVEDVRNVNIGGTKNVLEFSCQGQMKHIYFASSLLSVATTDEDGTLSESWPQNGDFDGLTHFAYPNSKFVGDILMRIVLLERGLQGKVFRLPLIAGNSKTGKFNVEQNHMMLRYLFIMKSGLMPSNPFPMVILPVDTCASVSVKLFFNHQLSSQSDIYNITHPNPSLDQEFSQVAERFGYPLEFVEFSEFTEKLFNEPEGSTFSMFKEIYRNEKELMAMYTVATSLRKWLEGVDNFWVSKKVAAALPDFYQEKNNGELEKTVDILERDLRYAKEKGWFEKFGLKPKNVTDYE